MTSQMKVFQLILIILLCGLATMNVSAKEGKIKYSKNIEFKGTVYKKIPDGNGSLVVFSRVDKKAPVLTVTGIFHKGPTADDNIVISDAQLIENSGLKIEGSILNVEIVKDKESERISLQLPECKIIENDVVIENRGPLSISLEWKKQGGKEWIFHIDSSFTGIITSNFVPVPQIMSRLSGLNEIISREVVDYVIENGSNSSYQPHSVIIKNVKEILFKSGLVVSIGNPTIYTFPNGDYLHSDSKGQCLELRAMLVDGVVTYKDKHLFIEFKNGERFEARDQPYFYFSPNRINTFQPFKDLKLSGKYTRADNSVDIYLDSKVVERKIPGGTISFGNNSKFCINFDNGNVFIGSGKNFIKNHENFINFTSIDDVVLNNGNLFKTPEIFDVYSNGVVVGGCWPLSDGGLVEYAENVPVKVKYPDGSTASGEFANNPQYNVNSSSANYKLRNGTKGEVNGSTLNIANGEVVPSNLTQIRLIAQEKGLSTAVDNRPLYYSYGSNDEDIITFDFFPEFKQLNDGYYYVPVNKEFGLSYPKSLIRKRVSGEIYVYTVRTNAITRRLHYSDMQFVWVYQPHGAKFGNEYGITKALYLINRETDEVVDDLTQTIKSGNNRQFESVDKPRYKYHERGRVEECPVCKGSGQMKYWGPPWHTTCSECGGKGWYIEHYW